MTNKYKFLLSNVGFHYEDLSLIRQAELQTIKTEMGLSDEWVLLALSKDSLDSWEKWGFNLFKKAEFKSNIDTLITVLDKMDDNKFKKEMKKQKKNNKEISVSYTNFKRIYEGVLEQGGILTDAEADKQRRTAYYTYSDMLNNEGRVWLNMLLAENRKWHEVDEDDQIKFTLAVKHVRVQEVAR